MFDPAALAQVSAPYLAEVERAVALVAVIQSAALVAFLAGDRAKAQRLEARAARVERYADSKARGWW
jgi:hypothetical protein